MKVVLKAGPSWRSIARRMEPMMRRLMREEMHQQAAPPVEVYMPPLLSRDELEAALRKAAGLPAAKPSPAEPPPAKPARKRIASGTRQMDAEPAPLPADPAPVPKASTVVVVPSAEAPTRRQPVVTMAAEALQARIAEKRAERAPPPAPVQKPKAEPQVITTTTKEVRAWLVASFKAGGLSQLQAQDRVGFMTHEQALTEANQRRLRAGYPPFAFLGARSAA